MSTSRSLGKLGPERKADLSPGSTFALETTAAVRALGRFAAVSIAVADRGVAELHFAKTVSSSVSLILIFVVLFRRWQRAGLRLAANCTDFVFRLVQERAVFAWPFTS